MNDILRRVAAADPARTAAALDDEARATLTTILATTRPETGRRAGRARGEGRRAGRLALAGVLAAAGVVTYLVAVPARDSVRLATAFPPAPASNLQPLPYDEAGTPARPYLLHLAKKAERQPRPAPGGPYHYVRTEAWSYVQDAERVNEWWLAADGSGRVGEKRMGAGALDGFRTEPLPVDPDALRTRLGREPGPDRDVLLVAVASAWHGKVVGPDESAAMLRLLAGEPGVVYRGGVTDRGGREGLVFTTDYREGTTRKVVVLHPDTGALLADEVVALDRAAIQRPSRGPYVPPVDLDPPFTMSYTLLLTSGLTESMETRP